MATIYSFKKGVMEQVEGGVVNEYPLQLVVNGREMATLIASPHDLRFLVAGFLRLQGFVSKVDDFLALAICQDFGAASVTIRGELPERLKPVLTSGCGTGISFNMPKPVQKSSPTRVHAPEAIFALMNQLAQKCEGYQNHGGMHSAGVGSDTLLLHAEDIGRHNTIDRIAGEALLKGISLAGTILVTSGRVSTELVAKASLLGIDLIASRTSPTDMAVKMAEEAGITLVGYVRADSFKVYTHAGAIGATGPEKIAGVTGVILAGGASSRMGSNKALLPHKGGRFIESIYRELSEIFPEVILVTNTPEQYQFLPCRKVPDLYPGMGALAGIHAGLAQASNPSVFTVACDMPHLDPALIRHIAGRRGDCDLVLPKSEHGYEPLHALYNKSALAAMEQCLTQGKRRIVSILPQLKVNEIPASEVAGFDPEFDSFSNINTPQEYYELRNGDKARPATESLPAAEQAHQAQA
ncbi:formate dehydrogenase accessory sulfurtransferase FdhD [Geomonas nitrogeniifigens]|uniref:Multifunctional fusion protein n=1 Tax=Geomonas diazotrophica TaxID=2843197 RepID=A0ABX8JND0_9BACT|nr:formate dehydrogenase accessory sulfurtransferase FdhD [Geomonas nitrogeniifigens]QWV99471.1 formate dehydrogenase accessory sulfurtransferase FdhD [Geomonas nitrogeniifigens]